MSLSNIDFLVTGDSLANIMRLKAFAAWYTEPSNKEKIGERTPKDVLYKVDINKFTSEEILGVVKQSGFYTNDDLFMMIGDKVVDMESKIGELKRKVTELEDEAKKRVRPECDLPEEDRPVWVEGQGIKKWCRLQRNLEGDQMWVYVGPATPLPKKKKIRKQTN